MLERVLDRLGGPRAPLRLSVLAWVISLPALTLGFQADDHVYRYALARGADLAHLFTLTPAEVADQRAHGFWVWWTSPRARIAFFRPLTWLDHWAEYSLFPHTPAVMLLINTLLYAGCVLLAVKLYARLLQSPRAATLAGLMFAVDEGHAQAEGWISARNTLLAVFFSLAALDAFVGALELRSRWRQAGCAAAVGLALFSGEAGLWAVALVIAYAAVSGELSRRERALALAPTLVVIASWAAVYLATGPHGVPGASFYRDLSHPGRALLSGLLDLPVWFGTLFGPSIALMLLTLPAWQAFAIGVLHCIVPVVCFAVTWKDRRARFFIVACATCVLPLLATVPQDRTAFGPSFGAFGCIACFCEAVVHSGRFLRFVRGLLLLTHLIIAPLSFFTSLRSVHAVENGVQLVAAYYQPGVDEVVLLNAPIEVIGNYAMNVISLPAHVARRPRATHTLYAGASALRVTRTGPRVLEIESRRGWGYTPVERSFCARDELPRTGDERHALGLDVHVLATNDTGLPTRVRFSFDSDLDDPRRSWLQWMAGGPQRWRPPAIGQTAEIPGVSQLFALPLGEVPTAAE